MPSGITPESPVQSDPSAAGSAASERRSLDRSLLSGIAWTGTVKWGTQVISWATTLLVARLLSPADYGIVGMATVVLGVVQLINEFGIGAAIVQRRDMSESTIARVGGFAVALGFVFFAVSLILAPLLAAFFGEPAVAPVVAVLGINFITSSVRTIPFALLMRDLKFRMLAGIEMVEALCLAAGTLAFALAGFGYWSLVLGSVAAKAIGSAVAAAKSPHRIAWPVPFGEISSAVRFGADVVVARLAWYAYSNADYAVVGRLLGKTALGHYSFGWTLASIPVDKIYGLYQRVSGAIFARVQHDKEALARYLIGITEGVALVSLPMSVGLALVADQVVPLVLGERWLGAIGPLRFLALASIVRSLDPLLAQLLISTGHSRQNARTMGAAALLMPVMFIAGSRWGATGVAAAWLIGHPLIVMPQQLRHVLPVAGTTLGRYLLALWPAASGCLVMTAAVMATRALADTRLPAPAALAAAIIAGAVSYAAVILLVHRQRVQRLRDIIRNRG